MMAPTHTEEEQALAWHHLNQLKPYLSAETFARVERELGFVPMTYPINHSITDCVF